MPRAKKSKVDGGGPSRSAGGRPRKRPAEPPPEEPPPEAPDGAAGASSAPPVAEPADADPAPVEAAPPAPEPQAWEPTPTAPPFGGSWRYRTPLSSDTVPSSIVRPRCLSRKQVDQRLELKGKYPYNNGICSCQNTGLPFSGNDSDHSMFCQLYKCFAYEVGCCEGRVYAPKAKDDPTMTWWWDCECIQYGFDPDYDIGGEGADVLCHQQGAAAHSRPCG